MRVSPPPLLLPELLDALPLLLPELLDVLPLLEPLPPSGHGGG
jgi:hypothetical protein